ncbi:MAG: pyridoxamine 5'-phosphate oxidase family protein [Clostridia bacterium]|nr:pyridoxamine 5'-phosphate oxidase family protein [Clostridia bacterium]
MLYFKGMNWRKLTREKQRLELDDCYAVLREEKRGVLSVLGDGDYPYGMPMNHYFDERDGNIYFHCGKVGHRLDSIKRCDKASFCVYRELPERDGEWKYFASVIAFGKVEIITDKTLTADIAERLSRKFTADNDYIKNEIDRFLPATILIKLTVEHISGKRVKES